MVKIFNFQGSLDEASSASLTHSPNIPHLVTVWGNTVPVQKAARV
jgi:hypothetical protein